MKGTSILIAEKHPLLAAGLKYFIADQEEFSLSGEAKNREDLIEQVKSSSPGLLIISFEEIPGFTIHDFLLIRQLAPTTQILAIATYLKREEILKVMDTGVIGILTRDCSQNEIINAMRATAQGEKFYCGKILDLIMEKNSLKEQEESIQLNDREIEIIRFITKGKSTKEIADSLNLSMHTINAYRKSLLKKLDARSPAELAVKAIKTGIIEL